MSSRTSTTLPDKVVGGAGIPFDNDVGSVDTPSDKVVKDLQGPSFAFPRSRRVTRGTEIEQVRKEGKRVRTASMEVRTVASLGVSAMAKPAVSKSAITSEATAASGVSASDQRSRVGIIVPKYGHSSVARNKVKRRLRELVRIHVLPVLPNVDVVLRVAPKAYTRSFDELREEVRKWSQQLVTGRVAR